MGAMNVPPTVTVEFDDGTVCEVQIKSRDAAVAERDLGLDFTKTTNIRSLYGVTLAALMRAKRTGTNGVPDELPTSIDAFIEVADLTPEDVEGKDLAPEASPG